MAFQIENAIPVLRIADMARSLELYCGVLGFEIEWQGEQPGGIVGLRRDGIPLMLSTLDGSGPGFVWIGCQDVRPVYDTLMGCGFQLDVLYPPTHNSYALDFQVCDFDGNVLWFGSGDS